MITSAEQAVAAELYAGWTLPGILAETGLLERQQRGKWAYYWQCPAPSTGWPGSSLTLSGRHG